MPVSTEEFKLGLRRWASGVTIVTARAGERVHGMTVSAFTSVSIAPPLVLVCADKSSDTLRLIEEGGVFAANLLGRGHEELSNRFAFGDERTRFDGVEWHAGKTGAPLLDGAIASIDCRVVGTHEAGDHVIYVGEVEGVELRDGEPMLYFAGRYRFLAPHERDGPA